jgi:hypothetical protein
VDSHRIVSGFLTAVRGWVNLALLCSNFWGFHVPLRGGRWRNLSLRSLPRLFAPAVYLSLIGNGTHNFKLPFAADPCLRANRALFEAASHLEKLRRPNQRAYYLEASYNWELR